MRQLKQTAIIKSFEICEYLREISLLRYLDKSVTRKSYCLVKRRTETKIGGLVSKVNFYFMPLLSQLNLEWAGRSDEKEGNNYVNWS